MLHMHSDTSLCLWLSVLAGVILSKSKKQRLAAVQFLSFSHVGIFFITESQPTDKCGREYTSIPSISLVCVSKIPSLTVCEAIASTF